MKILLAGGSGDFCTRLVERLHREKHDVYIILGSESGEQFSPPKKCIKYYFALDDERLSFIISSVMPDVIIFLGAMDENCDWELIQKTSLEFLSGLSNLLLIASSNNIKRFIYLSESDVYGSKYDKKLDESLTKSPESIRSLIISQGEDACLNFSNMMQMNILVLRFDNVYGMIPSELKDFAVKLFNTAMNTDKHSSFSPSEDKVFTPTYVSDAVDALYKAATIDMNYSGVYNVSGFKVKLSQIYKKIQELTGIVTKEPDQEPTVKKTMTVNSDLFSNHFGYRPIVDIDTGLTRAYGSLVKQEKKSKKVNAPKKTKTKFLSTIMPILENFAVFAIIAALSIGTSGNADFANINFMILYIIIISITFGLFQASVSILLASAFVLWQNISQGFSVFDFIVNVQTVLELLQYFIIGVLCGHMRDNFRNILYEKDNELADVKNELEVIYQINDSNAKIKQVLDSRLSNYEDSLAKIYSVVDSLNSLQPDEIFFSAVNVITEIMNSKDIGIYIVTDNNFKMCRLVAKTPRSNRVLRKSIPLTELGELAECMERDEIYVNRDLDKNLPMMAAPIFSGRKLVSIFMLWSVEFEDLTVYHVNRFGVLSKLISSIIERAYVYTNDMSSSMYLTGTNVLTPEAYNEILNVHKQAEEAGTANYRVFEVDMQNRSFAEIAENIKFMLRTTDYLGRGEDGNLYILLTNTNETDSKFVYDRLVQSGVLIEEVTA